MVSTIVLDDLYRRVTHVPGADLYSLGVLTWAAEMKQFFLCIASKYSLFFGIMSALKSLVQVRAPFVNWVGVGCIFSSH